MSPLTWIRNLSPVGKIAIGTITGILVAIVVLLVLNSLFLGLPINPQTYQYEYPNGTSATQPITNTSVDIHGSGVALSNNAYRVNYSERITETNTTGATEVLESGYIAYQINNKEAEGYLKRTDINMGIASNTSQLAIYENRSNAYIHNIETNETTIQETGQVPLVLTNQIELPQKLVTAIPHVRWKAVTEQEINGDRHIIYTATSADADQMKHISRTTNVDGTLQVNTRTNVITYDVQVSGTRVTETGDTVSITNTQSLTYTALNNSTTPERPIWATGKLNETDSENSSTTSDDEWTPPSEIQPVKP